MMKQYMIVGNKWLSKAAHQKAKKGEGAEGPNIPFQSTAQ
jgi:hypothetical protein